MATVPLFPLRMLAVKLAQLEHGGVELALVAVGVAKVVAHGSFLGREPLGFAIFGDGLVQLVLFVQNQPQVGVGLPESRV